ncbi:TetR/AcrR family transcriptional regulator [Nocardia yamanashiensis]|uniref:TetR/AcrR family transcriptional regulator n=1 Tax=Nocardia yamanashiensis TaxID=209247 RepID=UPI0008359557|nr:TetR/AcrR family transcriptional regulator [Nocardia yamanashiensis]
MLTNRTSTAKARRKQAAAELMTALRELLEAGTAFSDITIQQIAERAGVSRPAFYSHFVDKNDLLSRLVAEALSPVTARMSEQMGEWPSGPENMPGALRAAIGYLEPHRVVIAAFLEVANYDADVAAAVHASSSAFRTALAERISGQQQAGVALDGEPDTIAFALSALAIEMVREFVNGENDVDAERWVEIMSLVWGRVVYGERSQTDVR